MEQFDKIVELTNETNFDDLMYYFISNTTREKWWFWKEDSNFLEKIKSGGMNIEEDEKLQKFFKPNLNEIVENSKKMHYKLLNSFTNHKKVLFNYLIIILQLYLRLNIMQSIEKYVL